MSRKLPSQGQTKKKELTLQRLAERYYGKKDLLDTWDRHSPGQNRTYRNDLSRRVHAHGEDIRYRGGEK